ncbi:MAG: tetratricopeptide repeat protein [Halobacteriota archaeon]|nr:tetratricopeptide repeat protein [Halobacteriota archaeon]
MSEEERIDGKTAEEWFNLGLDTGDPKEKIKHYNNAIELSPENVASWYNKGLAYLLLERYLEAIECFDKVLEFDPENVDAWHFKGIALDTLSQCSDAQVCFNKAWELGMKDRIEKNIEELEDGPKT